MKPELDVTSVPAWAIAPTTPPADIGGRSWTLITFDSAAIAVAHEWRRQIASAAAESAVRMYRATDIADAVAALRTDLADAAVGWRLMVAGPARACLALRAEAVSLGVADDEMTFASTEVAARSVQCVHCSTVNHVVVDLEDVTPCAGCGRNLLVYYHVSRRRGTYLGFMADAEEMPA
ncbi:dimethylamine monooxygenase subunit DmmA family protein [Mycolicibacterium neoaurum]|uniref:dimethylamine monooxygenase subunit DmmA family protein n=1 Tax=Mycolicibacterium neoaurum TaxID=1795 RepID=UPI001F4CC170|nr:dimethylamine monooxygenase subunit DmmA family protein [Mycolicibacterium neoaurum]